MLKISVVVDDIRNVVNALRTDRYTAFAHCISGDFGDERQMSAGVAVVFAEMFGKPLENDCVSSHLTCQATAGGASIYGLVTKPKYYGKPTVQDYTIAFEQLRMDFVLKGFERLICSPMGCVRDAISL